MGHGLGYEEMWLGSFPQQNAATLRSTAWYVTKPLTKLISEIVEASECWGFAGRKDKVFKATSAPQGQERANSLPPNHQNSMEHRSTHAECCGK